MDLNEINVFIKVLQAGSFRAAAQQLGMPNSTVSAKVSSLEKRLGVTLLQRSTRKLNATPAGQALFEQSRSGLEQIRKAEAEVSDLQTEPQGLLRITAPVELGTSLLPEVTSDFLKKFPKVRLELMLSDRRVDLIAEGIDLAIRAGDLKDSSLIAKKVGTVYFAAFASPNYLKKQGTPKNPQDLKNHNCFLFQPLGNEGWKLSSSKSSMTIAFQAPVQSNDLNILKALALAGNGIALLPSFLCKQDSERGRMVRVLPEWRAQISPVHFVYPSQKYMPAKLRAFISHSSDYVRSYLGE